jgi:acyl-homoserine-lactone acylase
MRPRSKLVALAAAAAVLAAGTVWLSTSSASAHRSGEFAATIRYTEYGIPHIVGKNYADLGFGQGYAAARDNACTISQAMLTTAGQRSRHLGPDARPNSGLTRASTNLASDLYFQGINDSGVVERLLAQAVPLEPILEPLPSRAGIRTDDSQGGEVPGTEVVPGTTPSPRGAVLAPRSRYPGFKDRLSGPSTAVREVTRGYAAGVTEFLRTNTITDPSCKDAAWVRPMTEIDVYRIQYAISMMYGKAGAVDGLVAASPTNQRTVADQPNEERNIGSNAIALGRDATANGRGLSLGNPHVPWHAVDLRLWQSQLTIPGELDASGAGVVGVPLLWIGHTATMAWSGTAADNTRTYTLFQLRLTPDSPTTYVVDGAPESMRRLDVSVQVKRSDGSVHTVTQPQWLTRYGPVVTKVGSTDLPWTAETAYVIADANVENLRFTDATLALMRARTTHDATRSIAAVQGLPWMNILVTDNSGNATYHQVHSIPHVTDEKAANCNTELGRITFAEQGLAVLDGARSECAWGRDADAVQPGNFGPAKLPTQTRNDYLANANDSYWVINPAQPLTGYPRIVGPVGTERKARTRDGFVEIEQVLASGKFTRQALQDLMMSNRNYIAEITVDDVVQLCETMAGLDDACTTLSTWDRRNNVDSRGALLFDRFWLKATAAAGKALWKVPFNEADPVNTPNTVDIDNPAVAKALSDAVTELRTAGIPLDAPFGDHHYVVRGGERIPIGGGTARLGVYNAIGGIWDPTKGYTEMQHGASYLHAIAFDDDACPDTGTLMAYSQSADPTSPHYSDQTKLYSRKQWVTERFCERDILASPELRVEHIHARR